MVASVLLVMKLTVINWTCVIRLSGVNPETSSIVFAPGATILVNRLVLPDFFPYAP